MTQASVCATFGYGRVEEATGLSHYVSANNRTLYYVTYNTKEWKTTVGGSADYLIDVLTCKVAKP